MTKYKYTICNNEEHFDHIIDVLTKQGHRSYLNWDNVKDIYKDSHHDLALFWNSKRGDSIVYGNTGYTEYKREDIKMCSVPKELFEI